ncbi:MAG: hypothetical protein A2Z99_11625 [Treponema sp. GWB1_62_6]|nr:MAG: hypothetical protein A2Z99_11625 [Treponema sp. GWB1_62_6]
MRNTLLALILAIAAVSAAPAQNFEREAFLDAESRFLSRDYSLALERYDEFIRSWPASPYISDARYRRAVTLYRLGRATEAYAGLSLVEARFRSTKYLPYVPFWKAVIEYDRGDLPTAAARFDRIVSAAPDQDSLRQSLLFLGKASTALGEGERAKIALERLVDLLESPEDEPTALLFLSDLYSKGAEHGKLTALWERLDPERLDPATRELTALRAAEAYAALGRADEAGALFEPLSSSPRREIAIAALRELLAEARRANNEAAVSAIVVKAENALRSSPDELAEFWTRVGAGAFRDGRLDLARSYFLRVSALQPPERVHPDVPIYLAEIAALEKDVEQAFSVLKAAAPHSADREALLKTRLGWYALRLSRWEDARAALSEAVSAAAGDDSLRSAASSYLAYALYKTEAPAAALSALDASASASAAVALPGMARLRAELLRETGQAPEALEAMEALAAADPADAEVRVALMSLLFEKGRFDRVVAASDDFEKAFPGWKGLSAGTRARAGYLGGVASAATGAYAAALPRLDEAIAASASSGERPLGDGEPYALYYRAWALYRLARSAEAKSAFDLFLSRFPEHQNAYSATYLSAWSGALAQDYRAASASARAAADLAGRAAGLPAGSDAAELLARAAYFEGTLRPFIQDWDGALAALNRALAARSSRHPRGLTTYAAKAAFERGVVLDLAGRTDAADEAFSLVTRDFPEDALAGEASFRRGEIMYRAKRWTVAAERFAAYRQAYPSGPQADGALYFGGLALKSSARLDAGILLWERLLSDFKTSRYRFPATFAVARAYREKGDWEASFRAYTSAIAEFSDAARKAGASDEAETLRYMMTGLPETAARLQTTLNKENGAASPAGRKAAIALGRFYLTETAQREAGLPLLEEVIALRAQDPASAAEALLLKGDYYAAVGVWDKAAVVFLDAANAAADGKSDLVPESLFKTAQARLRSGNASAAAEAAALLAKNYPQSTWTSQAKRLLEGNR